MVSSALKPRPVVHFHYTGRDLREAHDRLVNSYGHTETVVFDIVKMNDEYDLEDLEDAVKKKSIADECNLRLATDDELVDFALRQWDGTGLIVAFGSYEVNERRRRISHVMREGRRNILNVDWIHFDGVSPKRAHVLCVQD
jgi:hypothetical protein